MSITILFIILAAVFLTMAVTFVIMLIDHQYSNWLIRQYHPEHREGLTPFTTTEMWWLAACIGLFYLFHHLVRYLN